MITNIDGMLESIHRYVFFTGKGGVGKTSLACATAIKLADEGKQILLISTDPASNLVDVLDSNISEKIAPVSGVKGLDAVNINPEAAADAYRDRAIQPLVDVLRADQIQQIKEELSGGCTTEIAAFDEFARFVTGEGLPKDYDVVIFDTAPTGHTLRLLELPGAWSNFIEENPNGATCIGPSSALQTNKVRYQQVVQRLRDPALTTVFLVTRPQMAALHEADRSSRELIDLGIQNQYLLINGYFEPSDPGDPVASAMKEESYRVLAEIPENLKGLSRTTFPLRPYNLLGTEALRSVFKPKRIPSEDRFLTNNHANPESSFEELDDFVQELTQNRDHGLVMLMGKGGVGKTILSVAVANRLAQMGYPVHLTTTDPAAHLQEYMQDDAEISDLLKIDRIDPHLEKQRYIENVIRRKKDRMDEDGLKLLREDLESPCTEEVAVFTAFSKVIHEARRKFVVIDTAPTGHTLLLLDTTGNYHKEVLRNSPEHAASLKTPYMYLQDKEFTRLLIVTIGETTPVNEAAQLQRDLNRAGIEPYGWVVNQSLLATKTSDPMLLQRSQEEQKIVNRVKDEHLATRIYLVPWVGDSSELVHPKVTQ